MPYETVLKALSIAIGFLHAGLAPLTVLHALVNKRDPRAAWGWIAVCILFPVAGPILYLLFGINRVKTRARKIGFFRSFYPGWAIERGGGIRRKGKLQRADPTEDSPFLTVSDALAVRPLSSASSITLLKSGEEAYRPMLAAIDGAERTLYLTTFIFETGIVGRRFIDALAAAAGRGVDVRVLIDGVGELYSIPRAGPLLRQGGVTTARFTPPRLFPPSLSINLRNHRKILTADGKKGFAGGMNIGGRHLGEESVKGPKMTDLHFEIEGPVTRQLEEIFLESWAFAAGEKGPPPGNVPEGTETGPILCRAIADGPDNSFDKLAAILLGVLSAASERIAIMTPYFLPSRELTAALQAAVLRGVTVEIILPQKNNIPFIHWATRNMLWELLEWGVRVFYQPPPFAHTKMLVVDGRYAQIGSANFDPRSLRLNFELAVEVYDSSFAGRLTEHFEGIRERSKEITLEEVDGRSLPVRLRDSICWLFSPYL